MKTNFTESQIKETMKARSINRKSALKFLNRENGGTKAAPVSGTPAPVTPRNAKIALNQESALKPEVAADYKARAANDDTKAPVAPVTPKVTTPKVVTMQTAAGKARGEGIRLFKLAGSPKKEQFNHVYGAPMGARWTWEQRAKAVGLPSAEAAAAKFQAMLLQPAGTYVVVAEKPVVVRAALAKTKTTTNVNPSNPA